MAKKFDNLSKNNKNINALSSIFSNDEPEEGGGDTPSVVTQKTLETSVTSRTSVILSKPTPEFVRQTLILAGEDLDFLRNLVYTRRLEGKVNYTQKEALQEVIQSFRLLHQEVVKERSDEVKLAEQKRSESIIKGKR
jgi:hypothetical protein